MESLSERPTKIKILYRGLEERKRYCRGSERRIVLDLRPGRNGGVVRYQIAGTNKIRECSVATFKAWAEVQW